MLSKIKRRNKGGQIDISFGFIFGIIIIVAMVAVAIYVISYFLRLNRCTDTGFMYQDIKDEVNKAWAGSGITQKRISENAPSGITSVCFGSLSSLPYPDSRDQFEALQKFRGQDKNVFLYPSDKACNRELANSKIDHVKIDRFFCSQVLDGKVNIYLNKTSSDILVSLSK